MRQFTYLCLVLTFAWLVASSSSTQADVLVFVDDVDGLARINYECTAGEVVRAFALDVSVDQGQILGISEFFVGESTIAAQGYGIFPTSARDHLTLGSSNTVFWGVPEYTPLANPADRPNDTLPGLNSSGVTLEFGGLWDPALAAAAPASAGTLCALEISESATVSVSANAGRGGVLAVSPSDVITPMFTAAVVDPALAITGVTLVGGVITIFFTGGELESAPTLDGIWTPTGNSSGEYSETVDGQPSRFYRVRRP